MARTQACLLESDHSLPDVACATGPVTDNRARFRRLSVMTSVKLYFRAIGTDYNPLVYPEQGLLFNLFIFISLFFFLGGGMRGDFFLKN